MKEFLIIPDQSFFEILFKINVNLSLLDEIENNYGQFILIDKNHENLLKIITKGPFLRDYLLWRANLNRYNKNYYDLLINTMNEKRPNIKYIDKQIFFYTNTIYKLLKQFNNGTSIYDAKLYGLSHYIKTTTNYEPIIISDDLDVNLHANFISSYFGINLFQTSSYEFLRQFHKYNILSDYVKELDIDDLHIYPIKRNLKKKQYEPEIKKLFKKCLLSLNPKIENDRQYKTIIKK